MTKILMLNEQCATVDVNGWTATVTAEEWAEAGTAPAFRDIEIRRIAEYKYNFYLDGDHDETIL